MNIEENAYVRSSLTPPPPPVYAMRTHRPRAPPPPCVRTLWMIPNTKTCYTTSELLFLKLSLFLLVHCLVLYCN